MDSILFLIFLDRIYRIIRIFFQAFLLARHRICKEKKAG